MCTQSKSLALIASGGKDGGPLRLEILIMAKRQNNSASQRTWRKMYTTEKIFYKESTLPTAVIELEEKGLRRLNFI
jgi:hypothetical protein